ncbi:MAG: hypothetical protein EZS26_002083 [Candidatus Ordinivivax streblomastigis]|uniref:DUF6383 domain-containing protein n=1 Tax=Candidatus Ordinivivax streblomastigis TaxID=2540710 RepID=A0A5M8P049_9BACT|nr:MAG: hypothetical protein EZS26_002083 [Candidatus Ordinivivax streblomastigis]
MRKITLSLVLSVFVTISSFTAKATQSVGYKLWDSNKGLTSTLVPSDLEESGMEQHIQIKFDGAISLRADDATLKEQIIINMASSRKATFAVNATDPSVLDILLSIDDVVAAQANSSLTVKAADEENGLIPGIIDAAGNPVKLIPIASIQPTGAALEEVSSSIGTATTPASATYRMSSISLVRSMNFVQAQSTICENPNGYLWQPSFTFHSHMFFQMTALDHFTTLTTAAVDSLQKAGYTLELLPNSADENNPSIKLTALIPAEGEKLSWIMYHYPYRAAADRKFELAYAIESSQASQLVIDDAKAVLYNTEATAAEVAAAIALLSTTTGIHYVTEMAPAWTAYSGSKSVILKDVTKGSVITVYSISGQIAATVSAKSDTETIAVPSSGIYIVRVNEKAAKVLVK